MQSLNQDAGGGSTVCQEQEHSQDAATNVCETSHALNNTERRDAQNKGPQIRLISAPVGLLIDRVGFSILTAGSTLRATAKHWSEQQTWKQAKGARLG